MKFEFINPPVESYLEIVLLPKLAINIFPNESKAIAAGLLKPEVMKSEFINPPVESYLEILLLLGVFIATIIFPEGSTAIAVIFLSPVIGNPLEGPGVTGEPVGAPGVTGEPVGAPGVTGDLAGPGVTGEPTGPEGPVGDLAGPGETAGPVGDLAGPGETAGPGGDLAGPGEPAGAPDEPADGLGVGDGVGGNQVGQKYHTNPPNILNTNKTITSKIIAVDDFLG
jgi:hypothetical protein